MDEVSIVIPVYINNIDIYRMTIKCLKDVCKSVRKDTEIIVVNDASRELKYIKLLKKLFPKIKILHNDTNLGFAKTINNGIRASTNDLILLLNNDIEIDNLNWLNIMIDEIKDVDMVAPKWGFIGPNMEYIGESGQITSKERKIVFRYLVGWCLLVRRRVFEDVGLIPENFGKGFFEDTLFSQIVLRNKKFKLGGIIQNIGVKHLCHKTFTAEGFNLSKEYNIKKKIFLDIMRGKTKYDCPKLG